MPEAVRMAVRHLSVVDFVSKSRLNAALGAISKSTPPERSAACVAIGLHALVLSINSSALRQTSIEEKVDEFIHTDAKRPQNLYYQIIALATAYGPPYYPRYVLLYVKP